MKPRMATVPLVVVLVAIFGLAAWFRVTSLETMHFPDADEAWYGVEALKLARGEAIATRTTAGNLIDPYIVVMEAVLLSVFEPSLWVLRAPSVAGGMLAILLAFWLGSRCLGREAALIASAMIAVLPIAVIFSRVGYYASLTPLFGVVTLVLAFRGRLIGVIGMTAAAYLLHPTAVLLLPAPVAVLLTRKLQETAGRPEHRRREVIKLASVVVVLVAGAAVLVGKLPHMRTLSRGVSGEAEGTLSYFLRQDRYSPLEFLTQLDRFLLGIGTGMFPMAESTLRAYDLAFWLLVTPIVVFGLRALVRQGHWDRVALVVGTIAATVGYGLVAGRLAFRPLYIYDQRYAMVLVAPLAMSLGCLAGALLVEPGEGWRRFGVRAAQRGGLVAVAGLLLLSVKVNWFDHYTQAGSESLWTIETEAKDPHHQLVSIIGRDLDLRRASGEAPEAPRVLTEEHWIDQPIRYLAGRRPGLGVDCLGLDGPPGPEHLQWLEEQVRAGAYVASGIDRPIEQLLRARFSDEELMRWDAVGLAGNRAMSVYRLRSPSEPPAGTNPMAQGATPGGLLR